MLRIHPMQHGFNLADAACEEALYDSAARRAFAGIDLGRVLQERGRKLSAGMFANATIIVRAELDQERRAAARRAD
jgi:hypothetical protein